MGARRHREHRALYRIGATCNKMAFLLDALNRYARATGKDGLWVSIQHSRLTRAARKTFWRPIESVVTAPARLRLPSIVDATGGIEKTPVDNYWTGHTIWQGPFLNKAASLAYIRELTDGRPLKRELARLHGPHQGKVI